MMSMFQPALSASAPSTARHHRRPGRRTTMKDGKILAKFYNLAAGRPYPPIGRLTSQITVQMNYSSAFNTSSSIPSFAAFAPTLASFGGYSSYTSLFDQYHIEQLEVWIEAVVLPVGNGNTLATCIDLDDATTPSTMGTVEDHPGALVGLGVAGRYHKWVPHIALAAYAGTFTSYNNVPSTWIDSASTGVQHYGFKVASLSTANVTAYLVTFRARVSFRAPGIN